MQMSLFEVPQPGFTPMAVALSVATQKPDGESWIGIFTHTDNGVKDFPQTAKFEDGIITVTNRVAPQKDEDFSFPVSEWENTQMSDMLPYIRQRELLSSKALNILPDDPFLADRIVEAQIRAIWEVVKLSQKSDKVPTTTAKSILVTGNRSALIPLPNQRVFEQPIKQETGGRGIPPSPKSSLSPEIIEALEGLHEMYRDYNQKRCEVSELLASKGHPDTEEYRVTREFFDSLKIACNSHARLYAYQDKENLVQYWAPTLFVRNTAGLYPRDWELYMSWLQTLNLKEAPCGIHRGSWVIKSASKELWEELKEYTTPDSGVYPRSLEEFHKTKEIIDRYFTPLSVMDFSVKDSGPLPTLKKKIYFGNVQEVTETDRTILLPQRPFGPAGERVRRHIREELTKRGFPGETVSYYTK